MTEAALAVLFALFVWWFSTGAILYLDGLPRRTYRWSMLGASVVTAAAIYGLATTASEASVWGAYIAFICGVVLWGWNEMAFLMGFITGSRRHACPAGCRGWRHFVHASETILHHELAILASAAVILWLTWGEPNQIGAWTFLALWIMRLSAKLNLFLGVPNVTDEFLPAHLDHLKHFFARRPMNLLFPVSVTAATVALVWLVMQVTAGMSGPFETAGFTLLAALVALGLIEHWFLVLPLPVAALWGWSLKSRSQTLAPEECFETLDPRPASLMNRRWT